MGISPSDPPSDGPKRDIVMGYPPSTSLYPATCHPQEYASTSFQQYPHHVYAPSPYNHPHGYPSPPPPPPSSSFQPHHGYLDTSPPFQHDGNHLNPNSLNPYPQPYNDYYYQQQYNKPVVQESGKSASFGRIMLILMIVLIASMCMMSLVMWFLFGTYIPEFEVKSIKVSNFTATNTTLSGLWNVGISISNLNKELNINFDHGMSSIFYKDVFLGISALEPFDVEKMQKFHLNFNITAEQTADDQQLQSWVLPALALDQRDGTAVFSLRVVVGANFTAPNNVYRQENLIIMCEDLQIGFSPATGEGTLSPGLRNTCLIRLQDGLNN